MVSIPQKCENLKASLPKLVYSVMHFIEGVKSAAFSYKCKKSTLRGPFRVALAVSRTLFFDVSHPSLFIFPQNTLFLS